ncbi:MAG TPA: pyridoxamine 5'-phosphate oxidase family protein [Aggregatilineales bacterium]|nr:pyridoxamine 5'-phosphate oxidase family protein [Anaerolineales bacterium]HRE46896.1 pyridoxamine 5'-phosphate oxidase family protein [Aggregatilineales bacterium]
MGKFYESISETLQEFIEAQHMFFVASAPLSPDGHVNLSPKGMVSLRVLSPNRVAYIDLIGSGNETSAHVSENGRITFMWCAFNGKPDIVRLYGKGRAILPSDPEWAEFRPLFPPYINARQIITADIHKVQTSCGYGVPLMDFVADRDTMTRWAEAKGEDGLAEYICAKNVKSIDGLPTPIGVRGTVR